MLRERVVESLTLQFRGVGECADRSEKNGGHGNSLLRERVSSTFPRAPVLDADRRKSCLIDRFWIYSSLVHRPVLMKTPFIDSDSDALVTHPIGRCHRAQQCRHARSGRAGGSDTTDVARAALAVLRAAGFVRPHSCPGRRAGRLFQDDAVAPLALAARPATPRARRAGHAAAHPAHRGPADDLVAELTAFRGSLADLRLDRGAVRLADGSAGADAAPLRDGSPPRRSNGAAIAPRSAVRRGAVGRGAVDAHRGGGLPVVDGRRTARRCGSGGGGGHADRIG